MGKEIRYSGKFFGKDGGFWRVEILQDSATPFSPIGELTFEGEDPLVIEWGETAKETVLCGSSATLRIESPADRTYQDLYTITPGSILLRVYKDDQLYWCGTLDPEFYEEPYERGSNYPVSLTFSDFGILERLKYSLEGPQGILSILNNALNRASLEGLTVDYSCVSTTFVDDDPAITNISVHSENFIDEDGEYSTLKEVVEGVLQPLGIKMIQKGGVLHLYDLNGLFTSLNTEEIYWTGESQTMSVDTVANSVNITFSPYAKATLTSDLEFKGKADSSLVNLTSYVPEDGEYYSYYPDYGNHSPVASLSDYWLVDFTIFLSDQAKGLKSIGYGCKYFSIRPVTGSASECDGVAWGFYTGGHGSLTSTYPKLKCNPIIAPVPGVRKPVLTTLPLYLPSSAIIYSENKHLLRIKQEVLFDARYNPFSGSTDDNEKENDNSIKVWSGFVMIPASVVVRDKEGVAICHYDNHEIADIGVTGLLGETLGKWVAGEDPGRRCFFEYYNPEDFKEDAGIRGWKTNRQNFGRPDGAHGAPKMKMYDSFKKMPDGQYLPYPPIPNGGYLEITIYSDIFGFDYAGKTSNTYYSNIWIEKNLHSKLRWALYKSPVVEIVNNNLVFDNAELDDIEYKGTLNEGAKEEISIDTICGTTTNVSPSARGVYFRSDYQEQIFSLKRAGRVEHPEQLLIGTLHSQYADRKVKLSGESKITEGLKKFTEINQPGKALMLMGETQHIFEGITDAVYCEFRPDEYTS